MIRCSVGATYTAAFCLRFFASYTLLALFIVLIMPFIFFMMVLGMLFKYRGLVMRESKALSQQSIQVLRACRM